MESLSKRFLTVFILAIFMISFASALEFDNVKSYDPVTREVTITNAFGFGDDIGKARLNTPLNVKVPAGENRKVAEFNLWAYEDYNNALKQFTFTDMRTKQKINKDFNLKYLDFEEIEIKDYDYDCYNLTKEDHVVYHCDRTLIGTHTETRQVWTKITPADLRKNDVLTVGVFVDVELGEYVDWIPTIYGVEVEEWATYEGTGGTITTDGNYTIHTFTEDGNFDWTGASINASVLVVAGAGGGGNGYSGGGGGAGGLLNDSEFLLTEQLYAITVGLGGAGGATGGSNVGVSGGNSVFDTFTAIGGGGGGTYNGVQGLNGGSGGGGAQVGGSAGTGTEGQGFDGGAGGGVGGGGGGASEVGEDSSPIEPTSQGNGGDGLQYSISGSSIYYAGGGGAGGANVTQGFGGSGGGGNGGIGGGRVSTNGTDGLGGGGGGSPQISTEPAGDGGDGVVIIRYLTAVDSSPNITLNSPSSANETTLQNLTINFTASDDINLTNIQLYVNDVLNQSNASGINNTDYLFDLNLIDGNYTIYGTATDNESQQTNSSSIQINIDTTPFIEFLTPPTLVDNANITQENIPIKINTTTIYFQNITYSLRDINGTNYTQFYTNETYDINFTDKPDGHYHYDVTICTTTNQCNTTEERHINHDANPPIITITSPTGIFNVIAPGDNLTLIYNITPQFTGIVDSCWYTYNGVNQSLNCSGNTTYFSYANQINNLTVYANDTFGNVGNETASWGYLILLQNQTYDSQVTEGTPNTITTFLNVVGDTISSALLSYNGTNYTTSLDYDSGNYTMASTVTAPLVSVDTNITFQLFMVISGVEYSVPEVTQLIQAINFSVCTTGDKLLNIFLFDEEDKTELFGTIEINAGLVSQLSGEVIESVLMEVDNVSNLSICLDPISSVDNFYLDADIVYSSDDYAKEFYFMRMAELSAIPINLSLFDLNLSSSTEFLVRYQGQNLIKVEGAIVQLQRYYVSSGGSETVEAPLTSISGTAIVHIDLNTVKYSAIVVKDGVVLDIFPDIVFDCENELSGQCTQNLYADVTPYNIIDGAVLKDFSYAISDTGDKLVTTFSIPSGSTSAVNIVMTQRDQFGETTSCNQTVTTSSGSLECDYNKTIGDSYLFLEINKDGDSQAEKEYFVPEANGIDWGGLNWLFLFGLLISVSLMAISSPEWIVGNAVVVLIIGGALWMADGLNIVAGLGLIVWIIAAAIVLILEMANKEDR